MTTFCDHKFVDSKECLKCGITFEGLKAASLVESDAVRQMHAAAITEAQRACGDDPTNKTQDHFKARRKLFEEVDRQIKGRVREVLPEVTLEFKRELDKSLGLAALRDRVQRVSDGISKDLTQISARTQTVVEERMDALLKRVQVDAADAVVLAFTRRVTELVAKECARQIAALMQGKEGAPAVKKKKVKKRGG